ncbi:hypothetical protein OPT61_g8910 [Boeremia exigua]|uniref:Uncharacterized protein n=1 Tax=Boeremia exigua TaxID=749465 RepID=A0ACC2HX44_9PLEO|nr:hypothetical protein OPT61_g8910 [Boeremia exigua]
MSAANGLATRDDLDVVWESVVQKFKEYAGPEAGHMKTLTVGEVLANLKPSADTEPETKRKAKFVTSRVLSCVQRVGDSVATATGAVFGPSQHCWNALNFVIIAVQGYKKVFEDLTLLLERVSVFLETLDIYLSDKGAETYLDT